MPTSQKGGATAPPSRRAPAQLMAKVIASRQAAKTTQAGAQQHEYAPTPSPREQAAVAIAHAKTVVADPHATHEEKVAASAAAYHAARRAGPKVLEANIAPPHGAERLVGQTLLDLSDAAIHSPGGMYAVGKGVTQDVGAAAHGDESFKHSRALAVAMGKSTAQDFEHPLRHPGFTGLDIFAALSAGAGTAARAGEVGRALRAGEIGTAAKAVVKAPAPGTRTYKLGDLEAATPNSKNVLLRAGQKAHARLVNASTNEGRKARIVGKHLLQEHRALSNVERADAEALAVRGKHLSTPQQLALRVVHEESPLATRIAAHERDLATAKRGSSRFTDLQQKVILYRLAHRYVEDRKPTAAEAADYLKRHPDATHAPDVMPFLRPAFKSILPRRSPGRLSEVSGRVEKVAAQREDTLIAAGKLTEEQATHRKAAPGRVDLGAQFEHPTPGKLGVPSPQLVAQRAHVARLEQLHARALKSAGIQSSKDLGRLEKKIAAYPARIKKARDAGREQRAAQLEHELAVAKNRHVATSGTVTVKVPGGKKTVTREMSYTEAETRLSELDKKYEKLVKQVEPHVDPYQGNAVTEFDKNGRPRSIKQVEQRYRNMKSKKGGSGSRYHEKELSIKEEVRQLAERKIDEMAAKIPATNSWLHERDRLREAIGEHKLNELGGETNGKTSFGQVAKTVETKATTKTARSAIPPANVLTHPRAARIGGALSVARDRLARMEAAAAKRQKPTGLVGAEGFTGGRSRIPYTREFGKGTSPGHSGYRGGEPRKPGSLTHAYTGALQRSGTYRTKTSQVVAESSLEGQKYADTLRLRDKVLKGSEAQLPPANPGDYVAVRTGSVPMPPELKNLERKAEEGVDLTRAEKQQLATSFDNWHAQVFRDPTTLTPAEYKGFRFVRRELLGKINQPRLLANVAHYKALRGAGHVVSETNNAVRAALLYMAPKYAIPNIGGNVLLNLSQQGLRAIPNFYRTLTTVDRDPDLAAKFRSAMGEGFARQLKPSTGITRKVSEPLAHGWSKVVDEKFRESALLDELRTLGFKTRDQLHAAFDDPHNQPKMIEAVQRAGEAIGDYDRLNAVEKDVIRHAIFFYTWLKVSARLSKLYVTERPIQSAAITHLGQLGEQKQQQELGAVPSYMEPLFKVGGSKTHPLVSNASALNVFTAADLTKAIINLAKGEHNQSGYQIADNLSPFFAMAMSAITGRDPFTQQPVKGNLAKVALHQLSGGLPQVALKQRIARSKTDQSSKAYTYTRGQALEQFGLGPLGEHGLNPAPTHQLAAKEHLADVPPALRSRITVFQRRQKFYEAAKTQSELVGGRLPKPLRDAFNKEAARQAAYATATHDANAKTGTPEYHHARLKADVKLLQADRLIGRANAQQILVWADKHAHDIDGLKAYRRYLSTTFYQAKDGPLNVIDQWRVWLEKHGAKGLG